MTPLNDDIEDLQGQIDSLRDDLVAVTALVQSLVIVLHEHGIPVRDGIYSNMAAAANQVEPRLPDCAVQIDELWTSLAALLAERSSLAEKTGAEGP